jgi:hypothetical protein
MRLSNICAWVLPLALLAVLAAEARTQPAQQEYTLSVSGQSGSAKVVQMNGHSYVDVDALARITNGSVAYQGNQILLTLPGGSGHAATSAPAAAPPPAQSNNGFSKEFLQAGIEFMSEIREWRNTLVNAIANGYPLSDALFAGNRGQAATSLRMAQVAANTQGDKSAAQLLTNEYTNMDSLTKKYLAKRSNLEFIDPNSMDSDALNQKILTCARSLAAMATNNQFADDGTCH